MSENPVLKVEGLEVKLRSARSATHVLGGKRILHDVHLEVAEREIVALIGETGSGKTTLARSIVGLVGATSGRISFRGRDITALGRRERRELRRSGQIQLIFQDPLRSLDGDHSVEWIVGEGLAIRGATSPEEREEAIARALEAVGLDPEIASRRPDQISGGQRQRVSLARAVVMEPALLLCDEPVSALDASTRNYVLRILAELRDRLGISLLVITHDLVSISGIADRVAVLYHGRVVEEGPLDQVFDSPRHPYTALLVASAPALSRRPSATTVDPEMFRRSEESETFEEVGGARCAFAPHCPFATDICWSTPPPLTTSEARWTVACHHRNDWATGAAGTGARQESLAVG